MNSQIYIINFASQSGCDLELNFKFKFTVEMEDKNSTKAEIVWRFSHIRKIGVFLIGE